MTMKKAILLFLISCGLTNIAAIAQNKKNDQIIKLDKVVLEVLIDQVSETEIFYKLPNNQKGPMQKIAKSEVQKIVFSSGAIDQIYQPKNMSIVDKIVRKDGRIIEGKIVSANVGKVEYKTLSDDDGTIYMVSGADISKIEYADGTVKDFIAKDKKPQKNTIPKVKKEVVKTEKKNVQISENQVSKQKPINKPSPVSDTPRFVVGIGGEGTYALEPLSKKWVATNDSAGIQQGYGISLRTDIHLSKLVAFSLTAGYNQWQIQRNYILKDVKTQSTTTQYSSLDALSIIPIQAGFKFYIAKGFYIMPEASFNFIASDFKNNDGDVANPNGTSKISASLSKVGFGGSVGCEVYKLPFVIDVSAHIHTIKAESFRNIGEPLYFAGLRLGIGFAPSK
jgi:hypothetical protein